MDTGEAKHFPALIANTAPFVLKGGRYALIVDIGDIDSVALQITMDGTTFIGVPSLQAATGTTANMSTMDNDAVRVGDLPPGQYRLTVSGADTSPAAVASVVRIQ